jgi:CIC family chloride channel protein
MFAELDENARRQEKSLTVEERLGRERTPLVFPDQPLATALSYFQRWPVLPISNRAVRGVLEGVVTLDGVLKRYQSGQI